MFRIILSIVISATLLGLTVVKCMSIDLTDAEPTEWLWFGLVVVVGVIALTRIIALAKALDNKTKQEETRGTTE
mgnify:CR=1 FL=1